MDGYCRGSHSKYSMKVHIILVTKYRKKIFRSDKRTDIVKQLKQYRAYQMWKMHREYLFTQYWNYQVLWSDGYFACSIGQVSQGIIEKYI